jgi:hypothetical protein
MVGDRTPYLCAVLADSSFLLGNDLLPLLVLAFGGAMAVGSALALVRPPAKQDDGELARPPLGRSVVMITIGTVAALWALASLLVG